MRNGDVKVLGRAAGVLLLASVARAWVIGGAGGAPDSEIPTQVDSLLAASETAAADMAARRRPLAPGERIDPNTATVEELDRLPGIGAALAQRIARERQNGPFRTAAELTRVQGIGPATVARLAQRLDLPAGTATRTKRSTNAAGAPRSLVLASMSAQELERLDGIGPVLAARIVEFRSSGGPVRTVDDLLAVPGIGPATLDRIRRSLQRVGAPPATDGKK